MVWSVPQLPFVVWQLRGRLVGWLIGVGCDVYAYWMAASIDEADCARSEAAGLQTGQQS